LCRLRKNRVPGSAVPAMLSLTRRGARGLPTSASASCLGWVRQVHQQKDICVLTVVALSDAILDPPSLCQVGNLGPVFIRVRAGTESTA
jgi:hypothetical protein